MAFMFEKLEVYQKAVDFADDELGCYESALFKIAKRLDIQPLKQRDAARGNQLISVVTEADDEEHPTKQDAD
jgi:hypothetical protein